MRRTETTSHLFISAHTYQQATRPPWGTGNEDRLPALASRASTHHLSKRKYDLETRRDPPVAEAPRSSAEEREWRLQP